MAIPFIEITVGASMTHSAANFCYLVNLATIAPAKFWTSVSTASNISVVDMTTELARAKYAAYLDLGNKKGLLWFDGAAAVGRKFRIYYGPSVSALNSTATFANDNIDHFWPFCESTGTSLTDTLTTANGTLVDGAQLSATGKIYRSVDIAGSGQFVSTGQNFYTTGNRTVFCTIYPRTSGNSGGRILDAGNFNFIYMGTAGAVVITSNGNVNWAASAGNAYSNYHTVVITRTSAGRTDFYCDGAQSGTPNQNSGTPNATLANVVLGNRAAGDRWFDGTIEQIGMTTDIKPIAWAASRYVMINAPLTFYSSIVYSSDDTRNFYELAHRFTSMGL